MQKITDNKEQQRFELHEGGHTAVAEYEAAFAAGFSGNFSPVTALAETVLAPYGGRCFAGLKRSAPEEWRSFKGTPQE